MVCATIHAECPMAQRCNFLLLRKKKTKWEVSLKGKLKDINTAHIHRNNF